MGLCPPCGGDDHGKHTGKYDVHIGKKGAMGGTKTRQADCLCPKCVFRVSQEPPNITNVQPRPPKSSNPMTKVGIPRLDVFGTVKGWTEDPCQSCGHPTHWVGPPGTALVILKQDELMCVNCSTCQRNDTGPNLPDKVLVADVAKF